MTQIIEILKSASVAYNTPTEFSTLNPSSNTYQVSITPSSPATSGTMTVEIKPKGVSAYEIPIGGPSNTELEIDMTNPKSVLFDDILLDAFQFTPVGFDNDKTYTVVVTCTRK